MQSHEAIQIAINGKTLVHAKALGMSRSMVNKWQEASETYEDSGAYNPLDRIKTIMDTSRAEGNGPERYLAPLHFLAQEYKQIVFPAPVSGKDLPELQQGLMKMTKEFGELLSVSGEKLADGEVTPRDLREIRQEVYEMQTALSAYLAKVEQAVKERA